MPMRPTRREVLRFGGAAGAGLAWGSLPPSLVRALAAPPACGSLDDIEHVVILIQENRSFDHYFGTYKGVRGFDDHGLSPGIFAQAHAVTDYPGGAPNPDPVNMPLLPFHIDTGNPDPANPKPGECTNDVEHQWLEQHDSWHGGALDRFVAAHLRTNSPTHAAVTMGYYTRGDLDLYYALADNFTICDNYFCSVIGGTDINRLYSMTGTMDPDAWDGGAQFLDTLSNRQGFFGKLGASKKWKTYPEALQAAGVTWKVYQTADSDQENNVLEYFSAFQSDPSLRQRGLYNPTTDLNVAFTADCASGQLPSVSWVLAGLIDSEHPPAPIEYGEGVTYQILAALTANPAVWAKTLLIITYDENGGFFDHVPPPTPGPGTPGEFIPQDLFAGDAGKQMMSYAQSGNGTVLDPIGLGFRVPALLISPFTRNADPGGAPLVASDVFDHTSTLRFLERRFGAALPDRDAVRRVPGISAWRRAHVGDLTGAINFAAPSASTAFFSTLPVPTHDPLVDQKITVECVESGSPLNLFDEKAGQPYPQPPQDRQSVPHQESAPGAVIRPSGLCQPQAAATSTPASTPAAGVQGLANTGAPDGPVPLAGLAAGAALAAAAWWARRRRTSPGVPKGFQPGA